MEEGAEQRQDNEKCEIKGGKQQDVIAGFSFVVLGVFPEGNQTGQGGNQRAHATDVDAQEKMLVIVCKLGQQDRRGDIADDLAGQHGNQQGVFLQQEREEGTDHVDSGHISGEDEEEYKGEQQGIIHHF